jgi:gamma-glutamyltranspeptidase/glutathione hydrolase
MTLEDLAAHDSTHVDPISYTYQNEITLHEIPPNGQGLAALIALGIVDVLTDQGKIDLENMDHNSAEYLHVLVCVPVVPLLAVSY